MTAPYGATVLEHFRRPRNQRALERPTVSREAYNPLCGDRVRLELDVQGGTVIVAAFTANACAICTAAASVLTEQLRGAAVVQAIQISDADLIDALGGNLPPARVACATLPLTALRDAIAELASA